MDFITMRINSEVFQKTMRITGRLGNWFSSSKFLWPLHKKMILRWMLFHFRKMVILQFTNLNENSVFSSLYKVHSQVIPINSYRAWRTYTIKWDWIFRPITLFCLLFGSTGVWSQGLALAGQVLRHLSHNPKHFLLYFFLG
jgi:hypothetical protein